jgi:hypothetical protein
MALRLKRWTVTDYYTKVELKFTLAFAMKNSDNIF